MARTGLYKSEVKMARDALLAQGKHPSVDAVRIALGNTGSKTTIHKYLKELEAEDGGADGRKTSISEALQNLVERLATQLQDEAHVQIEALQAQHSEQARQHAEVLAAIRQETEQLGAQWQRTDAALQQEIESHRAMRDALQKETVARHTAEQHATDLRERLAENEAHRQSLEEKHRHARDALEHYRQAVKDQRDQDQRRHEQQLQQLQAELRQARQTVIVKQEEVSRLNQDGARLVADLSHAQKALYDQQTHSRRLEQKLESLHGMEQRAAMLEARLADKDAQAGLLQEQLTKTTANAGALSDQVRNLELTLAAAQAKHASQQEIVTELRAYLDTRQQGFEGSSNNA
jgi:DNA repair exonuclease SbcCD ATPase subunit